MRILMVALVLVFFTPFAGAQTTANESANEELLSIPDKLGGIERSLSELQQTLSYRHAVATVSKALQALAVTEASVNQQIQALSAPNTQPVSSTLIKATEQHHQSVVDWQETIAARQKTLAVAEKTQNAIEDAIQSVEQLLSNPINLASVTDADTQKLAAFKAQVAEASEQIESRQAYLDTLEQQLIATLSHLNRLKLAQSEATVQQQQRNQQQLDTDTFSQLRKVLETGLSEKQSQLQNKHNELSLGDIEQLQQRIATDQTQLWLLRVDEKLIDIVRSSAVVSGYTTAVDVVDLPTLEQQHDKLAAASKSLDKLKKSVDNQFADFSKTVDIIGAQPDLDDAFTQRMKAIAYQRLTLGKQLQALSDDIADKKQVSLLSRDAFFQKGHWLKGWLGIKDSLIQITYQIYISFRTLFYAMTKQPWEMLITAVIAMVIQLMLLRLLARWVHRGIRGRHDKTGLIASLRKVALVIRKYWYVFIGLLFVSALVDITDIPNPSRDIICHLLYVFAFGLMWWELTQIEVRLGNLPKKNAWYSHLVTAFLLLCFVFYSLSYQSAVAEPVVNLYERFLLVSLVIFTWIMRQNITIYLAKQQPHLNKKVYQFYQWLLAALPWLVIVICLIGVIGFGHLAWLFLAYLGSALLYLLIFSIGIAVISSLRKKAKLYSIRHFKHGAFIAQDIVSPISTIITILWAFLTAQIWFYWQDWDSNSYLIAGVLKLIRYPVFTFGETTISLQMVGLLILSVYLIFRVAKWLRTFSYHWLYSGISDLGVRNSLSIFSQYVAALVGVLIALNVLGIDLTSLAVFAGALGVGVGLGLQDIAKNFISGILLLIERPLRSGDWIEIDGMEGTVKAIGMRAITVETFDSQEVIIPNGNAISNSFTNFTHSNTIMRTVLYVGAAYHCPPSKVIELLKGILASVEAILPDPAPAVILWEYADSSINYRIQYYINLDNSGLLSTRTAVLNTVWETFAEHDVEMPFPQRDIHFRNALTNESVQTTTIPTESTEKGRKEEN